MAAETDYVRRDVYEAHRETASKERMALAETILTEKRILEKDIHAMKDDIKDINDRTRWLLRSVGAAVIMVAGNFVFLMLTRAA